MIFLGSWNFAANLAAPFFAVYMLKTLGYSMTTIIVLTTASQLSNLAALGLWGSLIDRFSNKAVLGLPRRCSCVHTGLDLHRPGLVAAGGVPRSARDPCADGHRHRRRGAGIRQHRDETVARRTGDLLLATNSVVSATFAALAPIIGGLCADFFAAARSELRLHLEGQRQGE